MPNLKPTEDEEITVKDAAAILGQTQQTVYGKVWAGVLPHKKYGRNVRVFKSAVMKHKATIPPKPATPAAA